MLKALTAAVFLSFSSAALAVQTEADAAAFDRANAAMAKGDWGQALREAERAGPIARDIIEWHRLRNGNGTFREVQDFLARNGDWPGLRLLRRRAEGNLPLTSREDEVIAFFADTKPQTGGGALAYILALENAGRKEDAEREAIRTWMTQTLSPADENRLLKDYGAALKPFHEDRLDMLLWRGVEEGSKRMRPRVSKGWQALADARLALRDMAKGVDTLIEKVPAALTDNPGLAFERMQWRARKGRNEDAIELILATNPEDLGQPERWAGWRRVFARVEMRTGSPETAYELAAQNGLAAGSNFADLEWLAGYIALTYLDDADAALKHFMRFRGAVATPISLGRAGYWEGRAHEALGNADMAQLSYAFGAEYQTSFYGLLAAEKAGVPMDPTLTGLESFPDFRETKAADSTVFQAALFFIAAGQRNQAEQFLRHLAETLTREEIGALGTFLSEIDEPHLTVMVGKEAARRAIVVPSAYYPVVNLRVQDIPVSKALALAIARRESEFDPGVQSGVGARGLMQLMPKTAAGVAAYLELPFSLNRLISDPAYNARLGTAYLDEMMTLFDGNAIMVSAAYNAGPSRPLRWMRDRGDPRGREIDIVDWIEHMPFDETRNYVMRVAESLPVYRARLTGKVEDIRFTEELIATPGHERQAVKGEIKRPRARPEVLTD